MTNQIIIKKDEVLGAWLGMGGAITESAAYNFSKLSPAKQQKLIDAYYGKDGLDYRWGRLCIGSNDFCLEPFEYTNGPDLRDFSIEHDERYVLPMLNRILEKKDLTFIASPWSPPRFMKMQVHMRKFYSVLKPWYYRRYASYLRRWIREYERRGIKIDYLTPQNEPRANQIWESCFYSYCAQKRLAYKYLVDELRDTSTQILLWDHNKKKFSKVADKLLGVKYQYGRNEKVAGLCYHWYDGICADEMWQVRQKYPDIMMVGSEMCCGFSSYDEAEWQKDAKLYLRELFADINTGASAWIDWNVLLSWRGGPNYCNNYAKSPVILNAVEDDFILTPIYVVLKKVAKLFPAGSEVVHCECNTDDIIAIVRKDEGGHMVVVANLLDEPQKVTIKLKQKVKNINIPKSGIYGILI